jgi:hypothetical protein
MSELPNYVAMSPDEFLNFRANGVVSMGSAMDAYRQPGVVGMWNRKPVFLYANAHEQTLLEGNKLVAYFQRRGFKNYEMTDEPPKTANVTIP